MTTLTSVSTMRHRNGLKKKEEEEEEEEEDLGYFQGLFVCKCACVCVCVCVCTGGQGRLLITVIERVRRLVTLAPGGVDNRR